jgi:uncharacterized protein
MRSLLGSSASDTACFGLSRCVSLCDGSPLRTRAQLREEPPRLVQVRHDGGVDIRTGLSVDDQLIEKFCRRHQIRRLAVFGSALRDDFHSASDVDILVEFRPEAAPGLLRLAQMEMELSELLGGREVEMRTYEDLSRYFRDAVRAEATTLYDAA